ncbi:MAG: cation transporter [Clostridia bacterium]|nr:cation transporter [Clostridia bacterium]
MKKTFKLEDLDCANCAAKMEAAIAKLPGVNKVTVNFMAQKMILDAEDDVFDSVLKAACDEIKKVEPDCTVIIK